MSKVDRYKILIRKMIEEGIVKSQRELGEKMGYTNESSFSQIINQKVQEPKDFILRLKGIYPALNEAWLQDEDEVLPVSITDSVPVEVVEQIREEIKKEVRKEVEEEITTAISVPIVSEEASVVTNLNLQKYIEENADELERFNPADILERAEVAERIRKTSMYPALNFGDIVFLRFIKKEGIVSGDMYYFEMEGLPRMIRIVKFEGNKYRLKACNPKYDDIVIERDRVKKVAKIVCSMRFNFDDIYSELDEERKASRAQIGSMIDAQNEQVKNFIEQIDNFSERENRLIDIIEKRLL